MEQREKDKASLKVTRQELSWKEAEVFGLELAVEFGRCKQCNEPLDYTDKKLRKDACPDFPNCEPFTEPTECIVNIKIGQIFSVDGKKYLVILPVSEQQEKEKNAHGHIVCTLTGI